MLQGFPQKLSVLIKVREMNKNIHNFLVPLIPNSSEYQSNITKINTGLFPIKHTLTKTILSIICKSTTSDFNTLCINLKPKENITSLLLILSKVTLIISLLIKAHNFYF